jgi:hypothetical protein
MLAVVIAAVLGAAVGYAAGVKNGALARDLSDVHVATASHTNMYVTIARLLRRNNYQEALKATEAMIDVGASWLSPMPRELDAEDKAHVVKVLSSVEQYRRATRPMSAVAVLPRASAP